MSVDIPIPKNARRKALLVVDVQPAFLDDRFNYIVENILQLLNTIKYDCYVVATFHAEEGSLWDLQQGYTCPEGNVAITIAEIDNVLKPLQPLIVRKETRSTFRGDKDVANFLKQNQVEEVHIVGTQTNDCILATAFDAFDSGFFTYVIEECCRGPTKEFHDAGIKLLRRQNMTNHSVFNAPADASA